MPKMGKCQLDGQLFVQLQIRVNAESMLHLLKKRQMEKFDNEIKSLKIGGFAQ